jgi:hypothetical protein
LPLPWILTAAGFGFTLQSETGKHPAVLMDALLGSLNPLFGQLD